ncbi:hypothetical protein BV25DRAFT_496880 [Artomyces pyxidatus]|uniref:Uncharacterized protein n=1 Tax=Artomyces pyxidatus TaxID=48021 RepID=A0ACB8T2W3_9AGAM|nr:hypothetical protein BV25DRAFT_496880 [Artomyces pyxidatus]
MLTFSGSEIVALCLESAVYGLYTSLFVTCIQVLLKRRTPSGINVRLILVSFILFALITWHVVIDAIRLVLAFTESQTTHGADLYYSDVKALLGTMKTSVYLVTTVVSDLFILYRCYVVWNAKWSVIILPALLYIADCGTGIAAVYTVTLISTDVYFNDRQEQVTNSFFSCTLALNAVCTGLIAFRIWWTQRLNRDTKISSNLSHVTMILIESGSIYLVSLIFLVATYSAHSLVFNIFLDLISPIIGVVFSLIIVRVGRGLSVRTNFRASQYSSGMVGRTSAPASEVSGLQDSGFQVRMERLF